jgi:lipoate-protein ligase A
MKPPEKTDEEWRLIPYAEYDAAMNMAIDEAILESHQQGTAPPTVRLYGFCPPAVSIGYAQKLAPDVVARIRAAGLEIVRRPTGGRAVLHLSDLTYAFIGTAHGAKANEPNDERSTRAFLSSSIVGAYKQICQGLIGALDLLGVATELGTSDSSYRQMQDCFMATTTADLHHRGKKLVGSAQLRRGNGVLQHGSLLLNQDQHLMERLLTGAAEQPAPTLNAKPARHANLFELAGRQIQIADLESAMKSGFEKAFGKELKIAQLSDGELKIAQRLREKYQVDNTDSSGTVQHANA